jgi:RNA polymerase sigma-B factor
MPADRQAREVRALFRRLHEEGDDRARDELCERFLPLARKLARRYASGDEPLDDLVQVASVGLLKAIDRFDPVRGLAFSSFAVPTILGELRRHFRDRTWSLRMPRDLQDLSLRLDRESERLAGELGRAPSVPELVEAVGATEEAVLEALQAGASRRTASLDAGRADEDADEGSALAHALGRPEPGYDRAEDRATLRSLRGALSDRDWLVLELRFERDLTQEQIGRIVGVTQMQVSRIVRASLQRLHEAHEHAAGGERARSCAR